MAAPRRLRPRPRSSESTSSSRPRTRRDPRRWRRRSPMQLRIERRMLPHIPWGLIGTALLIACLGVWNLASASRPPHLPVWHRQTLNLAVGIGVCVLAALVDYRFIQRMAWPIYFLNLGALLALRVIGHRAKGAESWFALGP